MSTLIYAMCFSGKAAPTGPDGNVLRASTSSPSTTIISHISGEGLTGTIEATSGGEAAFASEVTFTDETVFQEAGTITFGDGNVLQFSTVGSGYLGPCSDPTLKHGTVMWRVEGGAGQFVGASGLITSNFFVSQKLEVTDHQFGVLFLP